MKPSEGTFKAILVTIGRRSGREHAVELKAVFYIDKFYFSRRNQNSDWLKNSLHNSSVKIKYQGRLFSGTAKLVIDPELCKKISHLKYSDERSEESRIVLEVTPYG
jgi:F420H(2)-dependent quinone reductase